MESLVVTSDMQALPSWVFRLLICCVDMGACQVTLDMVQKGLEDTELRVGNEELRGF